jgi:hypothetical protein
MTAESIGVLVGMIIGFVLLYACVWIIAATICWRTRIGRWGTWGKVIAVVLACIATFLLALTIIGYFIVGLYGAIKWENMRKVKA